MLIFNLAFPRDVDAEIAHFPDVQLFNLENLERVISQNIHNRSKEVMVAEEIIENETIKMFGLWHMNKALGMAYRFT